MRNLEEYEQEEILALDVTADPFFQDLIHSDEYESVDMGDGTAAQAVAIAKLPNVARRALDKLAAGFAGGKEGLHASVCVEFEFCEKLRRLGRLETAKLLASWLGGAVAAGVIAMTLDPSLIGLLALMLAFYALSDFCGCKIQVEG
ncbi:hypothetical protein [Sphingopyxis kveilinensis]|uniref:hypothetical protein n=1 Tax=Sphingopyxis kveilinensis TaxID=3114367 RepID=UPI0030CAD435